MDNFNEYYKDGIDTVKEGRKLGSLRGGAMGVFWGVILCITLSYNLYNIEGVDFSMTLMLISNSILLFFILFDIFPNLVELQKKYGLSAMYRYGYQLGYLKYFCISVSLMIMYTVWIDYHDYLKVEYLGIVLIFSYPILLILSIIIWIKSPKKKYSDW